MIQRFSDQEVDRLAELLRSDSLEEADGEHLREIIRHHPNARRRLVEQMYLGADLKEAISNSNITLTSNDARVRVRRWMPAMIGGLAAAAAILLIVAKPWAPEVDHSDPDASRTVAESTELDAGGFAVVSSSRHAAWGEDTSLPLDRLADGSPIGEGTLDLREGVVQIDFYSGVTVVLRGPSRFRIESPGLSHLDHGNLWANVPPPASGFQVNCKAFNVVDLGTKFGITTRSNGRGEVHVIDGEVRVQSVFEENLPETVLRTGKGVRFDVDGRVEDIPARPSKFLASSQLGKGVEARFQAWSEFQASLKEDPDVLVAYTLPKVSSWEREVRNHAESAPPFTNGAVVGCKWVDGRWPGKGALKFSNSSHRIRLDLPGLYDDLTLACWVRIDELGSQEVSLLHPETMQDNHIHWTILNVEKDVMQIHFAESGPDGGRSDRRYYHCSKNLTQVTSLGEWVHLGLVYDSKGAKVSHYVNGEVIGTMPIESPRKIGVGIADIGNWPYHEWAAGTPWEVRNLNGIMDEFLIMKRAWTPKEMRKLWAVGRP